MMGVGKTPPTNQRSMVPPRRTVKRTQNESAADPESPRKRLGVWPPNPAVHASPEVQRTPWALKGSDVCWWAQGGRQKGPTRRKSGYFAFLLAYCQRRSFRCNNNS